MEIHPDTPPAWQRGLRAMFGRVTGLERLLAESEDREAVLGQRLDEVGAMATLLRREREPELLQDQVGDQDRVLARGQHLRPALRSPDPLGV